MKIKKHADLISKMTWKELLLNLYITQMIVLLIAVISGSFLVEAFWDPDLFFRFEAKWIVLGAANGVAVVLIDILLMNMLPDKYYDDGGINTKLFSGMSYWNIAVVAGVVAVSEELLFRGILQTKFGLIIASIIFALIHIRYWTHWYLIVNVLVLSFWIGIVYEWSGNQLFAVMAMHFTIDFLLGIYIKKKFDQQHKKGLNDGYE